MNYSEANEYLLALGNEVLTMKLGLENIRKLLAALDNPQNNFLKVQVAGTNGKGSTCAFLDAICLSADIKTGLYTSPHLISVTERIKIGGGEISEAKFAAHATKVKLTAEDLVRKGELETVPTFFEQITAIALSAFAAEKVELAILETGLGGRFDATTAANAEIAAITPIDYDHQQYLGETLAEIAAEKAAIIRPESKVIVAVQRNDEAIKVILQQSKDCGVVPKLTSEIKIEVLPEIKSKKLLNPNSKINFPHVSFETSDEIYENITLNLLGRHQIENAATAILLAETLTTNFTIKKENIVEGLRTAMHRGRLEYCNEILFDGAHNISGAKALREFLDEFVVQPITMIFGSMRDKDIEEIAAVIFPKVSNLILTTINNPRSANIVDWSGLVALEFFEGQIFYASNVRDAYKTARKISGNENLICVTGSLYLVGEAQKVLRESVH